MPDPPDAVNVVEPLPQIVRFPETVGAGGVGLTVMVTDEQVGLNWPPLLLFTKYVVVVVGVTDMEAPVPI